jgi:hypothetical protein
MPLFRWVFNQCSTNNLQVHDFEGLLVIDGGEQPGHEPIMLWGKYQIPNEKYWMKQKTRMQSGGQSLVCVTNPLTREFILLPPILKRRVNDKIAKFVFINKERTIYNLVIVGWDYIEKNGKIEDILCVIVYSSQTQKFVHANCIEKARPIRYHECGRTGMAVINYGVYFGGLQVVTRVDDVNELEIPAIYYFNISHNRKQSLCFDFSLVNIAGRPIQAPKVVQAGGHRVFAATRYVQIPTIIWLVEVLLHNDGTPTGTYQTLPNGVMPTIFFKTLFPSEREALLPYECTNADAKIAFKVGTSNNLIVMYDMNTFEWNITEFPCQKNQPEFFSMCDGCYEPNFLARP